jgi:gluconolactonase
MTRLDINPRPRARAARAAVTRVVATDAHEGPVYAADEDALYFTTVPQPDVAIKRLDIGSGRITVVRADANKANGMTLDRDGRLVICEQGTSTEPARISRLDRRTAAAETVVDAFEGRPLNSPNDVVVRSDGTIWFTDPSYGHLQGFRPEPRLPDAVYRYDAGTDRVSVVADTLEKPNGLAFSPDESVLYVADNGAPHHLLAFDMAGGSRVVAVGAPGHPDGVKVDAEGRIYISSGDGIEVLCPDGRRVGEIDLPGAVNFTWGGRHRNVLYITADTAIWAAVMNEKGA